MKTNVKYMIPRCPDHLPNEFHGLIFDVARYWKDSELRPSIKASVAHAWDRLIQEWIADKKLPLLIRKFSADAPRGHVLAHRSGRALVPSDNTPANWSLSLALRRECPSIKDVRALVAKRAIPVAMAFKAREKSRAEFKETRGKNTDLNSLGWKVCHKEAVGLKWRRSIVECDMELLENHFQRFLSPSNMFVVPKSMGGLGELPHMAAVLRDCQ